MTQEGQSAVLPEVLLRGFVAACDRLEESRQAADPERAFFAIAEALEWAVSIDEGIATGWDPAAVPNWKWRRDSPAGRAMAGIRYARNSVHHLWAAVLYRDDSGFGFPMVFPLLFWEWSWRRDLPKPDNPNGEKEYSEVLAGHLVRQALYQVRSLFEEALNQAGGDSPAT